MLDLLIGNDANVAEGLGGHCTLSARKLRLFACACCRLVRGSDNPLGEAVVGVAEGVADEGDRLSAASMRKLGRARDSISAIGGWYWCVTCEDIAVGLRQTVHEECTRRRGYGNGAGLYAVRMAGLLRDIVGNPFRPVTLPAVHGGKLTSTGKAIPVMPMWWDHPAVFALARAAYEERERACGECSGRGRVGHKNYHGGWEECGRPACHDTGRTSDGSLDPFRLALLADALEEAGCEDESILDHLRGWDLTPCPTNCRKVQGTYRVADGSICPSCHGSSGGIPAPHVRGCHVVDLLLSLS